MKISVKDRVAYFLVAHVTPLYRFPSHFNLIKTADFSIDHSGPSILVSELIGGDPESRPAGSYLADYAIPIIFKLLSECPEDIEFVSISLHRKVILRRGIGSPAKNHPGMYIVSGSSIAEDSLRFDRQSNYLITLPLHFEQGIQWQYERAHLKEDFDKLLSLAVHSGVLPANQVQLFCCSRTLFPGVMLGVMPHQTFQYLANLYTQFTRYTDLVEFRCSSPNDIYQRRARSFFTERLCSHWLRVFTNPAITNNEFRAKNGYLFNHEDFGYCITVDDKNYEIGLYSIGQG
jgi:hypothetical protein